jgi:hypothetical protein
MIEVTTVEAPQPRRRGGARWIAAGAAIAVAAGALGYVAGRAGEDGGGATEAPQSSSAPDDTVEAAALPAPAGITVPGMSTEAVSERPAADSYPAPDEATSISASGSGGSGQYYPGAYAEEPGELLGERTAGDVTLRVHRQGHGEGWSPYWPTFPGWSPEPWCYPSAGLRIGIASPTAIGTAWASYYDEPKDGLAVSTFAAGHVEGDPLFGAVVQVAADVTAADLTTATGSDTAAPQNGIVLLVVHGPIDEGFTLTVHRADGSSESEDAATLIESWNEPGYRTACEPPPPALPDPGGQPSDPDAAKAEILAVWAAAHDETADTSSREQFIDDASGVAEAWQALAAGEYSDAARDSTAEIAELVFSSPTEAWFRYDVLTPITSFYDRYGRATLTDDGRWVLTRQTICQDLALAPGAACEPAVEPLLPPSAANDPRYGVDPMPYPGDAPATVVPLIPDPAPETSAP